MILDVEMCSIKITEMPLMVLCDSLMRCLQKQTSPTFLILEGKK